MSRLHGIFGSKKRRRMPIVRSMTPRPFNPKQLVYEVFGPPRAVADISYFDVNSAPRQVDGASLPWSLTITTNLSAVVGNIVAQGDSNTIGCRIVVDGVVKAERISHEVNASTFLLAEGCMSTTPASTEHARPPFIARAIRMLSVPILRAWLAITVLSVSPFRHWSRWARTGQFHLVPKTCHRYRR